MIYSLDKFLFGLFYIFLNCLLGLLGYLLNISSPGFNLSDYNFPMGCCQGTGRAELFFNKIYILVYN